jgi:hypothetical protein
MSTVVVLTDGALGDESDKQMNCRTLVNGVKTL